MARHGFGGAPIRDNRELGAEIECRKIVERFALFAGGQWLTDSGKP
jgi:hypothetical protein